MITESLSTLKIHKLTQAQYDRELAAGNIDPNALYLTPDEAEDLSRYATIEQLNTKADIEHSHEIPDINGLQNALANKSNEGHTHTEFYTKTEVDTAIYDRSTTLLNRSTAVNEADINYTTLMARGSSLNSTETTPNVNGAIAWTYE